MIRVYSAADPADAHLVCALLKDNSIQAVVQGENLWMARGEVPLTPETAPSVWVNEPDVKRARALIEQRERPSQSQAPSWKCSRCGQVIEGQFSECWRCAGATPDGSDQDTA